MKFGSLQSELPSKNCCIQLFSDLYSHLHKSEATDKIFPILLKSACYLYQVPIPLPHTLHKHKKVKQIHIKNKYFLHCTSSRANIG